MSDEFLNEIFRLGRGKLFVESDDEQVPDAESADQSDLVLGGAEQVRRCLRAQDFFRMRTECNYHRRSIGGPRMIGRRRDDRLVSAMNAVKDSDGQEQGAGQLS